MRVYTTKKTIVNLKHFQCCAAHVNALLNLQQMTPNLPLEIDSNDQYKRYIPIHEVYLERDSDILVLNAQEAAVSKG